MFDSYQHYGFSAPEAFLPPISTHTAQKRKLIGDAMASHGRSVHFQWKEGLEESLDLAPLLASSRRYRRIRDNDALFRTLRVGGGGAYLVWADGTVMETVDIALLPELTMSNAELRDAMDLLDLSYEGLATHLGVSTRLVGAFRKDKVIPPHIALAVRHLLYLRLTRYESEHFTHLSWRKS
jgi:hypothetical protein